MDRAEERPLGPGATVPIDDVPVPIALLDGRGAALAVNGAWCRLTGQRPEAAAAQGWWEVIDPADHPAARALLEGRDGLAGEWHLLGPGGRTVAPAVRAGAHGGTVLSLLETTEHRHREAELEHRALHDPLTGLWNRGVLVERVDRALERAHRAARPPVLVLLDLDGFKAVNDRHGHPVGDEVLRVVAARLRAAAGAVTVARLGGDEFGMLFVDDEADDAVVDRVVAAVRAAVSRPITALGVVVDLTVASGRARASGSTGTFDALFAAADRALYARKAASGRPTATRRWRTGGPAAVTKVPGRTAAAG